MPTAWSLAVLLRSFANWRGLAVLFLYSVCLESVGSPKPTSLLALREVWRSLSASSRTLLVLCTAQTLTAATFAVIQFAQDFQLLLQDTALILCSAVITLGLLLDAFVRENAFQLLACLALGALNASQLVVYLAAVQGQGQHGAVAAVPICLVLQLAAAAVSRPAYLGFGWRMYSRIASNWRLKPAEQQQLRTAALDRQRFAALARADGLLLTLMLLVVAINAANPGGSGSQPQPLGLLVGATVAALPLCAGWLAACWVAARRSSRRRLAAALDFAYPLCHVPPMLVIFAGASHGSKLSQPHGQTYLILYPLLFLVSRTATWWAARRLSTAQHARQHGKADEGHGEADLPLLPPELLALARGAWLLKLPSGGSGGGGSGLTGGASGTLNVAHCSWSGGTSIKAPGGACWGYASDGWGQQRSSSQPATGRQRFFQLSHDASCLRWDWNKWVLCAHIQGIQCCDKSQTVSLQLVLEPDLRLRFTTSRQYCEWRNGLQLLLALLLQPEELLPSNTPVAGSAVAAAAAASRTHSQEGWRSSSLAWEFILQVVASPRAVPAAAAMLPPGGGASLILQPSSTSSESWPKALIATAAGLAGEGSLVQKLRVYARSDSQQHLQAAMARSQAAIVAAVQRQMAVDSGQGKAVGDGQAPGLCRGATFQLIANASSMPELSLKTSGSCSSRELHPNLLGQVPAAAAQQQQQQQRMPWHSPCVAGAGGNAVKRLRSGLRRAITLPTHLWRSSSAGGASGTPRAAAGAAAPGNGSPSKQPLTSLLQPSSSSDDLTQMAQQEAEEQQQAGTEATPHHERRLTLSVWAEQAAPLLDLRQLPRPQRPPGLPLSGRQHYAVAAASPGIGDGETGAEVGPRRSVSAGGEPVGGVNGRELPRSRSGSPFIHLVAFAGSVAGPSPRPGISPAQASSTPTAAAAAGAAGVSETGPSIAGSEASTPRHYSPQRGSPNRQQQLQSFQAYLQQQLQQQQRGRYGPYGDASTASGSGSGSGRASTATSPQHSSPSKQQEADTSLLALPGCSPPATAREGGHDDPRSSAGLAACVAGAGTSAAHRLSFISTVRGVYPGVQLLPPFDAPSSSAPLPGMMSAGPFSASVLTRADSSFSSWGLPSPTTATAARTPFGGLSRLSSLLPSVAHTPLATYHQHPSFATPHQQQQVAAATLLTAEASQGRGEVSGAVQHPYAGGNGHSGVDAAGGRRHRSRERPAAGGEREEEDYSFSTSRDASFSAPSISIVNALGITVPVEMVDFRDLVFGKFLGEGAEGSVYAAWYRETPVAVKRTSSLMEVEINLHAGAHDNIVGLRGLCSHGSHLYLIMELCPRGTLDKLIHKGQGGSHRLDPLKLLPIVRSIARGMLHLHTRRPAVFHRDLKPGNLFIGHGGVVKVGDFGMSRYATAQWRSQEADGVLERTLTPGVIGTAAYSAPELLNPETPEAADAKRQPTAEGEDRIVKVYSFGVTLYEIMERKRPFAGMDSFQIQTQWYLDPQSMRLPPPTVPDGITAPACQIMKALAVLVERCTHWDPEQRPTFQDILATLRAAAGGAVDSTAPPTPAASLVNPF